MLIKVLITGATGFLGGHLLSRLEQLPDCQLRAAIRSEQSQDRLRSSIDAIVVGEIDLHTDWSQALEGIETVIHLAGRAHILDDRAANPEVEFIRVNTEGTVNLVRQSIQAGVKHFIFISSIGAMATLSDRILTETTPPQPDTHYGRSKLQAETELIKLAGYSNLSWTILRPTLVYGEGNPGNMASLIKLIKRKIPLPLGAINNQRSFLYVGNLVDAIAVCLTNQQAKNQLFLISDTQKLSTPQLISQIAQTLSIPVLLIPIAPSLLRLLGSVIDLAVSVSPKSLPLSHSAIDKIIGSLAVDCSHICQTLDWHPPYTTEQGLDKGLSSLSLPQSTFDIFS